MAFAETARLGVDMELTGNFKSQLAANEAAVKSFNKTTTNVLGGTASNFSLVKQAAVSTGVALKGMGTHLKNVITGPLGLIGLSAGLFSVAGAFHEGISKASDMAATLEKLQGLTGGSAEKLSTLIAVFDKFGISGAQTVKVFGFAEKALGNLATTFDKTGNSKLQAFDKQFGITLTNSKGKALEAGQVLLKVADYWNSTATQSNKAAVAAKFFSRNYTQMIPILKLGSKGILEAQAAAASLGLELTQQNATDLKDYQKSIRDVGEAIGGLELQVGLVFVPLVKDAADSLTKFLVSGGKDKLVAFFKDGATWARNMGNVLANQVIPTLQGLASAAKGFWELIPPPLRDLLFKGIVADRTIHFLFGVSPLNLAKNLIGDVVGPLIGRSVAAAIVGAGIGKAFVQPVFVTNPGFGGGLPGGGGLGGIAATAAGIGTGTALAIIVASAVGEAFALQDARSKTQPLFDKGLTPQQVVSVLAQNSPGDAQTIFKRTGIRPQSLGPGFTSGGVVNSARQNESFLVSAKELKQAAAALKAAARAQMARAVKAAPSILATGARHDMETSGAIQSLIVKSPSVYPTTNVTVNVTASGIHKTVITHSRYGPSGGSRVGATASYGGNKWSD